MLELVSESGSRILLHFSNLKLLANCLSKTQWLFVPTGNFMDVKEQYCYFCSRISTEI